MKTNQIKSDFIKSIGSSAKGYKAYIDIGNNNIGITPSYTMEILKMYIADEVIRKGYKVLKIVEA